MASVTLLPGVLVWLVVALQLSGVPVITGPSTLTNTEGQIVLMVSPTSTFTLECQSPDPVQWLMPDGASVDKKLMEFPQVNGWTLFRNTLTISNTVESTGRYVCTSLTNASVPVAYEMMDTAIYVYIYDGIHLHLVPPSTHQGRTMVVLPPDGPFIFPCLPTHPNISVSLVPKYSQNVKDSDITFDPTIGFTVLFPSVHYSGEFMCDFTYENKTDQLMIMVVLPNIGQSSLRQPDISTAPAKANVGQPFNVSCSLLVKKQSEFSAVWDLPKYLNISDHMITNYFLDEPELLHSGFEYKRVISTVEIKQAVPQYSGMYTCTYKSIFNEQTSNEIYVHFYECGSSPCTKGVCYESLSGYRCQCPTGSTGEHCDQGESEPLSLGSILNGVRLPLLLCQLLLYIN